MELEDRSIYTIHSQIIQGKFFLSVWKLAKIFTLISIDTSPLKMLCLMETG